MSESTLKRQKNECRDCEEVHEFWWDCPRVQKTVNLVMCPDTSWREGLSDTNKGGE